MLGETDRGFGAPQVTELFPVKQFYEISGGVQVSIDQKGRIVVPARFKNILSDNKDIRLFPWLNNTLVVSTPLVFARLKEEAASGFLSHLSPEDTSLLFDLNSFQVSLDTQGRILIPAGLRTYADLHNEGVAVGRGDHIEYWNTNRLGEHYAKISKQVENVMPGLPMFFAER